MADGFKPDSGFSSDSSCSFLDPVFFFVVMYCCDLTLTLPTHTALSPLPARCGRTFNFSLLILSLITH